MGSTLLELRTLLEDQIESGVTNTGTDPSSTLLNTYINKAQQEISREIKPRELQDISSLNIVINQNYVELPSGFMTPIMVNFQTSAGRWISNLVQMSYKKLAIDQGATFFDSSNTGDPYQYAVFGTNLYFNKYFNYTGTGKIAMPYQKKPTALSVDADTNEIPSDYDMLTIYKAMILYYQKDDDSENLAKYRGLAAQEASNLRHNLYTNDMDVIGLDNRMFLDSDSGFNKIDYILNSVQG
ncbi:MAG: hypothetical protein UR43_C0027G0013 [candidate division TM6 bacterium GW2011_GWF2_33_332]|nr:MAG: hypothetical protein UR43_C0027G0013 [candidate division TM6 bacterium GW2011_GWF2_33_332]